MENSSLMCDRETELANCTFAKTVLMFCIILYHSMGFARGRGYFPEGMISVPAVYDFIIDWFSSFQNHAFVLISGYIYSYIRCERGGGV